MFFWTIGWVLISLIIILLVHNIFIYLRDTLTVPKTRDLISKHDSRYNELMETSNNIHTNNIEPNIEPNIESNIESNYRETQSVIPNNMENELKQYLDDINTNNIYVHTLALVSLILVNSRAVFLP